jgi:hypothetical protein
MHQGMPASKHPDVAAKHATWCTKTMAPPPKHHPVINTVTASFHTKYEKPGNKKDCMGKNPDSAMVGKSDTELANALSAAPSHGSHGPMAARTKHKAPLGQKARTWPCAA